MNVDFEEGVELSRLTTIGTGGPARAFARPESVEELEERPALGCASGSSRSRRSGSARTCSSPTTASTRSCSSSPASSPRCEIDGELLRAGGGAANAVCLHRARAAGARRLRVRVRDPRHDRRRRLDERRRLRQRLERDPRARARRDRRRDGLAHAGRARPLVPALEPPPRPGRRAAEFQLHPRPTSEIQADGRDARRAAQGDAADEQAHLRQRLQESASRARARGGCSRRAASRATGSAAR